MCVIVYGGMFKELEAIKARVKEMEEEAEKLKEMQKQVEETIMSPPASQPACKMKQMFLFSLEKYYLAQPILANLLCIPESQGQGGCSLVSFTAVTRGRSVAWGPW